MSKIEREVSSGLAYDLIQSSKAPRGLHVQGNLWLGNSRLTKPLPEDLYVDGDLDLNGNKEITSLPPGLKVSGSLIVSQIEHELDFYHGDETLPQSVWTREIKNCDCPRIKSLPDNLYVGKSLFLAHCIYLESLPTGLHVGEYLDLDNCRSLKSIPDDLYLGGTVNLENCQAISKLPETLKHLGAFRPHTEYDHLAHMSVYVEPRDIYFNPRTLQPKAILSESNTEIRRALLQEFGIERFVKSAGARLFDQDKDNRGGTRKLLHVPLEDDESITCLQVECPSTKAVYLIRVPPQMQTCEEAAAWIAGLDDLKDFNLIAET